jgi:hypothetical protein
MNAHTLRRGARLDLLLQPNPVRPTRRQTCTALHRGFAFIGIVDEDSNTIPTAEEASQGDSFPTVESTDELSHDKPFAGMPHEIGASVLRKQKRSHRGFGPDGFFQQQAPAVTLLLRTT